VTDLADGRHPNDAGYMKMANIWFGGIQEVISKGFLTEALANSTSLSKPSSSGKNTTLTTSSSGMSTSSAKATQTQGTIASNKPISFNSAGARLTGIKTLGVLSRAVFLLLLASTVL
jgi:hypothetical protein